MARNDEEPNPFPFPAHTATAAAPPSPAVQWHKREADKEQGTHQRKASFLEVCGNSTTCLHNRFSPCGPERGWRRGRGKHVGSGREGKECGRRREENRRRKNNNGIRSEKIKTKQIYIYKKIKKRTALRQEDLQLLQARASVKCMQRTSTWTAFKGENCFLPKRQTSPHTPKKYSRVTTVCIGVLGPCPHTSLRLWTEGAVPLKGPTRKTEYSSKTLRAVCQHVLWLLGFPLQLCDQC